MRELVPTVRVDANGGWSVEEAAEAAGALTADGPLEYLEQPCATVDELAELRRRIDVPIAADESIRKADDPLAVVRARAADIAVLKVAPLGGVSALLDIAAQIDIPVVVSSALDSAVGIGRAAAARPCRNCAMPAGWAPAGCSSRTSPRPPCRSTATWRSGRWRRTRPGCSAGAPPERRQWWIDRVKACYPLQVPSSG